MVVKIRYPYSRLLTFTQNMKLNELTEKGVLLKLARGHYI